MLEKDRHARKETMTSYLFVTVSLLQLKIATRPKKYQTLPIKKFDRKNRIDKRRGNRLESKAMTVSTLISGSRLNDFHESLLTLGYGRLGVILNQRKCEGLRGLYTRRELFRSRIDMARYRFGGGEYQYFDNPLPPLVQALRELLYSQLVGAANRWSAALRLACEFPEDLNSFQQRCHSYGQKRPPPLLLRYQTGDFNCLHQDLYGDIAFPFQVIFCLSKPDREFTGGELLLVEQQPRAQSIGHTIRLDQGEGVVITNRYRPVKGVRGYYRTNVRHGISRVLTGERYALGIIFHDAA